MPRQNETTGRPSIASLQLEVLAVLWCTGSPSAISTHFQAFLWTSYILVYAREMLMQHGHECKFLQSLYKNNHFKQVSRDNRIGVNPQSKKITFSSMLIFCGVFAIFNVSITKTAIFSFFFFSFFRYFRVFYLELTSWAKQWQVPDIKDLALSNSNTHLTQWGLKVGFNLHVSTNKHTHLNSIWIWSSLICS